MTEPRKRVLAAHILGEEGKRLLRERNDVELVEFQNTISKGDFLELLNSFDAVHGVILGLTPFGAAELDAARGLNVVSRIGVGYDAVDIPTMSASGIPVMVCADANHRPVAEHTLAFMLSLAKQTDTLTRLVKDGRWQERYQFLPVELDGKSVLVVGCGRIGSRVVELCLAFGMQVNIYDPYLPTSRIPPGAHQVANLDDALATIDFLTLHCPRNRETLGLIGHERLERLKPSACLINTARGGLVDEQALVERLRDGHLAGAALDVFMPEPPPPELDLAALPNLLCSPHVAGVSREAVARMAVLAAGNVIDVFDGRPNAHNAINAQELGLA
ncbi:Hydroxypyruvate reductase [compost metagenome]